MTGTLAKIRLLLTAAELRNALVLLGLMVVGMTLATLGRFDDQYGRLWR